MVLTWSATTRKAVEKAGPWTRWKTKPRFPTASTAPWKSRKPSEIPTFPPPLRFALSLPNQRRRGLLEAKPDNSRVNKTGQLDLLNDSHYDDRLPVHRKRQECKVFVRTS